MDNDIFRKLLQKHVDGQTLSPEEEVQLKQGYDQLLEEDLAATEKDPSLSPDDQRGVIIRNKIDQRISGSDRWHLGLHTWKRIAAVFLIGGFLLGGGYWFLIKQIDGQERLAQQEEILPGDNKALLTLSDGSVISLSDVHEGIIATQEGIHVEKDAEGNIRYDIDNAPHAATLALNTIATPNGGQYRITLPDGSVAVLNAASSLSYPVHFADKERRVKMTGEVYFEVKKRSLPGGAGNLPFFVETAGQEVQVLGTHFNINAYNDEAAIKTTLAEGSVKVRTKGGQSALLKPGQQAVVSTQLIVQQADIQQQLAWVNGDFIFRGETLESLLRQVARWYDVEVECPAHIRQTRFNGMISRSQPLSVIVKMIQSTKKVKISIQERRLIVTD